MSDEKTGSPTCCKALATLAELYPGTIYQGVIFDRPSNRMDAVWMIRLLKTTPSGRVSTKHSQALVLAYCPCCGAQLQEVPERKAKE